MNDLISGDVISMSTVAIAEVTGKDHDKVTTDWERISVDLRIDTASFRVNYRDSLNRKRKCYDLPKRECLILVSGYSVSLRAKIIDRWQELESASILQLPSNIDCYGLSIEANNRAVDGEHVKYFKGTTHPVKRDPISINFQNHATYVDNSNLAAINSLTPHQCRHELINRGMLVKIRGLGYWPTKAGRAICAITKVGSYEDKQAFVIGWPIDTLDETVTTY